MIVEAPSPVVVDHHTEQAKECIFLVFRITQDQRDNEIEPLAIADVCVVVSVGIKNIEELVLATLRVHREARFSCYCPLEILLDIISYKSSPLVLVELVQLCCRVHPRNGELLLVSLLQEFAESGRPRLLVLW
eukprot:CAMPEP_0170485624 /NCGR_PEP_ID=MMETSP0208-20121228/4853_1 /TAXON_ID=197538 /ORGANISM="Strombidium inclinatum, Strain S3" /LENGTH=132 /DNA_ID=CAMNT_0010759331 /DNA_START=379 /DNA_END=774 /DNA_ORIENTATION=+